MKPQDKSFRSLKKDWYKKLKKDGFDDIEQNEDTLKNWETSRYLPSRNNNYRKMEELTLMRESKQKYFQMVGHFLFDHVFDKHIEKVIWELWAEGVSQRKIEPALKKKGIKYGHTSIQKVIKKLEILMFKRYLNEQK